MAIRDGQFGVKSKYFGALLIFASACAGTPPAADPEGVPLADKADCIRMDATKTAPASPALLAETCKEEASKNDSKREEQHRCA